MYSIGEFSRVTGLSVKALRLYHEKGILVPTNIDVNSGYRYYNESKLEQAYVIKRFKEFDIPLADIAELLARYDDDSDILEFLESRKKVIEKKISAQNQALSYLDQVLSQEYEAREIMKQTSQFEVEEKSLPTMLIAGFRMRGKYEDCGKGFAKVCKAMFGNSTGKVFSLYYDSEFKEDDADFETCVAIKKPKSAPDIDVRELRGGRCLSLIHKGPYQELTRSYDKILKYAKAQQLEVLRPSREVYIKGPGMFFKGNPAKYITEIQFLVDENAKSPEPGEARS